MKQDEENVATVYSHGTIIWVKSSRNTRKKLQRTPASGKRTCIEATNIAGPEASAKQTPNRSQEQETQNDHTRPKPSMKSRRINDMHSQTQRPRRRPKSRQNTRRAARTHGGTQEPTRCRGATGYLRCPAGVHLVIILILSFTFVLPPSSLASAQAHMILSWSQGSQVPSGVSVCVCVDSTPRTALSG